MVQFFGHARSATRWFVNPKVDVHDGVAFLSRSTSTED
jgi:hypothetical protein